MDSASDLDATATALQVVDGGGAVRGGGSKSEAEQEWEGEESVSPCARSCRASFYCAETILECFANFPSATAGISDRELWASAACEAVEAV